MTSLRVGHIFGNIWGEEGGSFDLEGILGGWRIQRSENNSTAELLNTRTTRSPLENVDRLHEFSACFYDVHRGWEYQGYSFFRSPYIEIRTAFPPVVMKTPENVYHFCGFQTQGRYTVKNTFYLQKLQQRYWSTQAKYFWLKSE